MNTRGLEPFDLDALAGLATELANAFVALSGDIALVIDADGSVRDVVQGAAGVAPSAADWIGRPWADTVTGDTRRKIEGLLSDVRSTGRGRQREVNLPADKGSTIPVAYAAIRLGANGPVLAVGRDLRAIAAIQQRYTESQREMERDYWRRRQAESRYRLLFQVAHDAVLVVDALTMAIVEANRAAAELFGLAPDALPGKHATIGIDRSSWPVVEELLASARTNGRAAEVRARLTGGARSIDMSATPFRSDRDLLLLVRAREVALRDAADNARASASDDAAVPQWAELVQRTPDAVVITDSSGRVLMFNPAFTSLCDLPAGETVEGSALARWTGAETAAALLAQTRRQGMAAQGTASLTSESGVARLVSVSATLLDETDRECIGFTFRLLEPAASPLLSGVDEVATAIDALAELMGRQTLPELMRNATELVERHLIKAALQRTGGDRHVAALLLGVPVDTLLRRLDAHLLASLDGSDRPSLAQLN